MLEWSVHSVRLLEVAPDTTADEVAASIPWDIDTAGCGTMCAEVFRERLQLQTAAGGGDCIGS